MILETILKLDPATAAALVALDSFVQRDGATARQRTRPNMTRRGFTLRNVF